MTRYHARRPQGKVIVQDGSHKNSIAILDLDGNDITIDVLGDNRRTVLLLFPDLPQVGVVNSYDLNELTDAALVAGASVIGLTPATAQQIVAWKDLSMASYPIYNMDDSELKMLARGNPAVVYIEDGIIMWKRTLSAISGAEQPIELAELGKGYQPEAILSRIQVAFIVAMLAILALNRTHLIVRYFMMKRRRQSTGNNQPANS